MATTLRTVRTSDQVRSLRGLRTPADAAASTVHAAGATPAGPAVRGRLRERRLAEAALAARRWTHERRIAADRSR